MILIKNIKIYSPKYIGKKDILLSGGKITCIDEDISFQSKNLKIIDGTGKILIPGFIDQHVHITGGGGEGSFKTRVPEIMLSKLTKAGITTVIGILGTDGTTRSVENLIAKTKGLKEEGISAYAHTGSYEYPSITITGSVKRDIIFIDEIIGVKIALSDHRSSSISTQELARLASDARAAGMIGGKAGIVVVHMGDGELGFNKINELIKISEVPIKTIRPTHINRNRKLFNEAIDFAMRGGIIDLTCGMHEELSPRRAIKEAMKSGVPVENITISSDGYGSWSRYDEFGNLVKIGVSSVNAIYEEFKAMVLEEEMDLELALKFVTSNIAKALNLYPKKGAICSDADGDVILLEEDTLKINTVIANGEIMVENGEAVILGTYE